MIRASTAGVHHKLLLRNFRDNSDPVFRVTINELKRIRAKFHPREKENEKPKRS